MADTGGGPGPLPVAEAEQIFVERIVPALLAGVPSSLSPKAVVLSAQAGAGKSVLARDLRAGFDASERPVLLDVDAFREFYPGYQGLLSGGPDAAEAVTQPDARRWLSWSIDHVVDRGLNVVVEHGLRNRAAFDEVVEQLARSDRGYRIEGALLATPAAESRLGILARYQSGVELAGGGRYVSEAAHDERFAHLRSVADWMMNDDRFEAVAVYERGQIDPASRFERDATGDWSPGGTARAALDQARQRPWPLEQARSFVRVHHSLSARMDSQWAPVLERAWQAATPMLHPDVLTPRSGRPAVTFGRYQIVSIAHLDTIRTILLDWPTIEIAILDLDRIPQPPNPVPGHLQAFYDDCATNTSPSKNPMSTQERVQFWEATLEEAGLAGRASVSVIARPELDPEGFNRLYPPERFDLVFPAASGEGFDLTRNAHMAEVLDRPVETVEPPLEYHTSDIRSAYQAGDNVWRNGLAPGGLEAFIAADGPSRLLAQKPSGTPRPDPARIAKSIATRQPNRQRRPQPPRGPNPTGHKPSP